MTAAVRFQVVDAGARRVVAASPAARPELRLPQAHPVRPLAAGRVAKVASCAAARRAVKPSPLLVLKVAVVGLLALGGAVVSVGQLAADSTPDPAREYVAGDPAWAHVQP
ncbi:hypothetical protein [Tessaracoccus flavescens]|uniref:Uncharacterized protein n=1 Tax=Tessaracoccus flavescens TaxID=399497 RepID=A0A1Q2D0X7_9ACTN|nr:hypothetical protein [Tessaracoccus flavescens]AQP51992.1 hypothetical protein BW733_15350 [Tessaracoccus flavescens]